MKFFKKIITSSSCIIGELLVIGMIYCFWQINSEALQDSMLVKISQNKKILRKDLKKCILKLPVQKYVNSISINLTQFIRELHRITIARNADQLEIFKEDLKKYRPNAPWITDSFMNMDLKQFSYAFKKVIKILTVPQKRWFYFSNTPVNFDAEKYWPESLWQCVYFERWMSSLSMDNNQLIFKDSMHPRVPIVKILSTIEQVNGGKNLMNKYYQFYAFYTDCLSNFFCQSVYSCYSSLDDVNSYKLFLATAKKA